jgi:OHCU decarboxylase
MTLAELNELSPEQAEAKLLECCGSKRWAKTMSEGRPFPDVHEMFVKANEVWLSLRANDWLEAFGSHPKIGETKAATTQSSQEQGWSAQEQSGVASASSNVLRRLSELNRTYEERFGFIFIVCASGKSSEDMLSILNRRICNDRETELSLAAEEQRKITEIRLKKLLQLS